MKAFKLIILLSFLIVTGVSHADAQLRGLNPMNTVYGEFYLISPDAVTYGVPGISYERLYSPKQTLSLKVGVLPDIKGKFYVFPVTVQGYTVSGRQHHVEYGAGFGSMLDFLYEFKTTFYIQILGGYRYSKGTGLVFRATGNVIFLPPDIFFLSPSISVGYMF